MEPLPFPAYLDHIRAESARFREVLADCDPAARVPACPDWDAADLLWHLTTVQAFWAKVVGTRPGPPDEADEGRRTGRSRTTRCWRPSTSTPPPWSTRSRAADPAEEAWHWSADHTVGASYRRQAHEALIHRLDAEEAAGQVTALDPALAADGVLEALTVMYGGCPPWGTITPVRPRRRRPDHRHRRRPARGARRGSPAPTPTTARPTTSPTSRVVERRRRARRWRRSRGTAADLDAWLWHRGDGRVEPSRRAATRACSTS